MLCWTSSSGVTATGSGGTAAEGIGFIALISLSHDIHNSRANHAKYRLVESRYKTAGVVARQLKLVRYSNLPIQIAAQAGRDGGTGRRSGLKIRRPLRSWGFDPPSRHQQNKKLKLFRLLLRR